MADIIKNEIDILEDGLLYCYPEILKILLKDKTTGKNILWATKDYEHNGEGFGECDEIKMYCITGLFATEIQPRATKSKEVQTMRIKAKAEVFTPCWICNEQNNLVDDAWFGRKNVFNTPNGQAWVTTSEPIVFDEIKTWQKYVDSKRLEITCGEAPYLVSRYDAATGSYLPILGRIGLLDRKLRVICENCDDENEWYKWTIRAYQSVYGYEFQGDSLLIARENLFYSFIDYYKYKFGTTPSLDKLKRIANIISWNIWQMDGLTCTVPYSCHSVEVRNIQASLFDDGTVEHKPCPGCEKNDMFSHNGIYCKIKDWRDNSPLLYVSILQRRKSK